MKKILLICISLAFYSCSPSLYVNKLDESQKFYQINKSEVKVFLDKSELPSEYQKLAILEFKDVLNTANIYDAMKDEAAKIGANGIMKIEEKDNGGISIGADLRNGIRLDSKVNSTFLAIRFKVNGEYPKKGKREHDDMY